MAPVPATTLSNFEGSSQDWMDRFSGRPLADDLRELDPQGQADLIATIRELCRLVPAADVASPKWSGKKPIVVLGRAQTGNKIMEFANEHEVQPRIGLCREQGKIQLFVGHATIAAYCADDHDIARTLLQRTAAWDTLRDRVEGQSLLASILTEDEDFLVFLTWVQRKLARTGGAHEPAPTERPNSAEAPEQDGYDDGGPEVGDVADAPVTLPSSKTDQTSPDAVVTPSTSASSCQVHVQAPAIPEGGSSRYFGALLRSSEGALYTRVVCAACAHNEFPSQAAQVLALVTGTGKAASQTLEGIVHGLLRSQRALDVPEELVHQPLAKPSGYVYLYFRNASPAWTNVFYVGMSASDAERGASHLRNFLRENRAVRNTKSLEIDRALGHFDERLRYRISNMAQYEQALNGANGRTVFLHAFNRLTKIEAFMVEHFLIQRLGSYSVSNQTVGNAVFQDYEVCVLPSRLDPGSRDWMAAVEEFSLRGCLSSLLRAKLDLPALAPVAELLNQKISEDARLHGRLTFRGNPNYTASNGQDATINYDIQAHNGRFRLELLASRKEPSLRINLRPHGNQAGFRDYMETRGLTVSNPGSMYCKPFAPDGEGKRDIFFPASLDDDGSYPALTIPELQWLPDGSPPRMNILDAVHAVVTRILAQ